MNDRKPRVLAWLNAWRDEPYWAEHAEIIRGNADLFKNPLSVKPDLIYVEMIGYESLAPWAGLKRQVPIIQWIGDCWGGFPQHLIIANPAYTTATLVVDNSSMREATVRGYTNVHWAHFGSEHLYKPLTMSHKWNAVFTGQSYGGNNLRCDTVAHIQKHFPDIAIFGHGWEGIATAYPPIDNTLVNEVYAQSKVVICHDINNVPGFTSVRTFNAFMGGHFVLMKRMPETMEQLGFEHRKHLVLYNTAEEALEHLNHYINIDPGARESIAHAGREQAIAAGLKFDHFVQKILAVSK